ncbi:hypothetical protein SAMN02910447_03231 [Ruminococcus sp. YE71]|uniref:hypothetical protein n=1 Tax=unclassified Ruminococcus TaxID=2608920 RepID=UPI000884D8C8|nr:MULTISPECIES: hypothetical protein [unclassified Ruminococcus]SDA30625.1 hypothetical protein SAMN02910446_03290 [Ruminococcus sp. YE78]SFW50062.1 hypothetical protein SAMN02910447_03231 [Ruminococcus sp. YE71]
MRSDKTDDKPLKSYQRALIYLAVWLIPVVGLKLLFDNVLGSLILHIAYAMMLLPAVTLTVSFIYSKRGGLNPWLPCYMGAAVLVLYFGFGFRSLSPDFIVTNLVCGFFGFALGNVFRDEGAYKAQYAVDHAKKLAEEERERNYRSIIDNGKKKK